MNRIYYDNEKNNRIYYDTKPVKSKDSMLIVFLATLIFLLVAGIIGGR